MKTPLVSVLITVYNDEKNIAKAIESILNQTFRDFEIVIVNDGSTDYTQSILNGYRERYSNIKVVNQANAGTADAANTGLSYCSGKYIARLDSDDISYPYRLQEEVSFLETNPLIGLVGGGCDIIDESGRPIGSRNIQTSNPYKTLIKRCIYQQSDVMFRKEVLDKISGEPVYRGKFKGAEDYDLWLRISEVAGIAKIDRILGAWKLNNGGYTLSRKQEQLEAINELRKMAVARRKGMPDWYGSFEPRVANKTHRISLHNCEYDKTIAQVLLKERRTTEVRSQLEKYKSHKKDWALVKKWYYLSYLPKSFLKLIFDFREFLLNHSSLELR